ncbi:MAG: DUF177 domain-containing protein [Clostridia bacterium]|nr:DUF177 domain-containing protein [Clostridia bacterium]
MKYDLSPLSAKKLNVIEIDTTFTFTDEDALSNSMVCTVNPVNVKGTIKSYGNGFKLDISYESTWQYQCGRCLEPVDYVIKGEIIRSIVKDGNDGDDDYVVVESTVIDLYDVIYNDIVLNLPSQVMCDEECKGLCPNCGKNLNTGACECSVDNVDPRLAKLKNLFTHD